MERQRNNILFVCTGNTCRSPMAEVLGYHIINDMDIDAEFRSAGVATIDGLPMSATAEQALRQKGITAPNHKHASRVVTEELLEWADIVLTMTDNHRRMIINSYPIYENKIYNFKSYIYNDNNDIVDPFGGSIDIYMNCANELEQMIGKLANKFKVT